MDVLRPAPAFRTIQPSRIAGWVAMVSLVQFGGAKTRVRAVDEDALAEIS